MPGIDQTKFQPMIRDDKKLDISISPLELSLNKYSDPVPEEVSAHKSSI